MIISKRNRIIFTNLYKVKIIDFGISTFVKHVTNISTSQPEFICSGAGGRGTPGPGRTNGRDQASAPELRAGRRPARADRWQDGLREIDAAARAGDEPGVVVRTR